MHIEASPERVPPAFCWTRIGDEAGESVERIVRRKELERQATGGLFTWGIGNGLGEGIRSLVEVQERPQVLFSPIRSVAADIDRNPDGLLLWLDVVASGSLSPLPTASWVTSRNKTAKGAPKLAHYALFCRSHHPLTTADVGTLHFRQLRNLKSLRPVGFSQVTAVVSRVDVAEGPELDYPVVLSARLASPFFGRLATPVPLDPDDARRIDEIADFGNAELWLQGVAALKARARDAVEASLPPLLTSTS
jgi:hypothetical protein